MRGLENTRKKINEIDKKIASLFEERMDCSREVAEYKVKHALPILDASRENDLINHNLEHINNEEYKEYYVNFLKDIMRISRSYQSKLVEGMKIAYSGVVGAFAHIACMKMFPNANYISYPNFALAYKAVEDGECDTCVLPIENSYAGEVGIVSDLMFSGSLYVNQVIELEVVHNLLGKKGSKLENIKTVISHEQALNQCVNYIRDKNFDEKGVSNTAVAAKLVADGNDSTIAAIASLETAKIYDLEILDTNINSSNNNTTRFGAFSRYQNISDSKNMMEQHIILLFTVKNEAGALAKTLNIIGSFGFNMRSLRSRPMKELIWNYYFYCELEGDVNSAAFKDMLKALNVFCDKLKLVGSYVQK